MLGPIKTGSTYGMPDGSALCWAGWGVRQCGSSRLRCKTPCQRSVLLTGHILIAICDSADTWETGLGAVTISSIVRD